MTAASQIIGIGNGTSVSATISPSYQTVSWSSSDPSIATVSGSGSVTGVSAGVVTIIGSITDPDTQSVISASTTITVCDSDGILNNTAYYIMNASYPRYMSLETLSDANNTNVAVTPRSTSTASRWTLSKQSNGSYRLTNGYSSTGRALYKSGSNLVIYKSSSTAAQFYLLRMDSGEYQGLYLIKNGNKFVSQDDSGNVCLINASEITARSYWCFMAVEKGCAELMSTSYSGFVTTGNNGLFENVLNNKGYSGMAYINPSSLYAYSCIQSGDMFVFRGHGSACRIYFYDYSGNEIGNILDNSPNSAFTNAYYINQLGANALATQRCVMYLGCSTGVSRGTYNLVYTTFDKGAHFALGTTQTTQVSDSNNFLLGFLNGVNSGYSIEQCIAQGIYQAGTQVQRTDSATGYGTYPIVYVGDTSQYLN